MELNLLKKLHTIIASHDNICPRSCYLCEEREAAILLPNEEKIMLMDSESMKQFMKHNDGFYYLDMKASCPYFGTKNSKGACLIYPRRPIDCRIFPFYPYFDLKNNSYILMRSETYCPIAKETSAEMELDVKKVINIVNNCVSNVWKRTYNELNYQRYYGNLC